MAKLRERRFRPLSGNLLSLQSEEKYKAYCLHGFRPLSGNLLSLRNYEKDESTFEDEFSSPIGESTFSTFGEDAAAEAKWIPVFVPYRGIYFLYYLQLR